MEPKISRNSRVFPIATVLQNGKESEQDNFPSPHSVPPPRPWFPTTDHLPAIGMGLQLWFQNNPLQLLLVGLGVWHKTDIVCRVNVFLTGTCACGQYGQQDYSKILVHFCVLFAKRVLIISIAPYKLRHPNA